MRGAISETGRAGKLWENAAMVTEFLSGRSVASFVGEEKSQYHQSLTGLPQGSVLLPVLFNIFIRDMFKQATADHCKYADDATFWHKGKDVTALAKRFHMDDW